MENVPNLMTPREVWTRGSFGKSTFYHLVNTRRLRVVKIGRATRIRREDFELWLASLTDERAAAPRSFGFKIRIETLGVDKDGDGITVPVCEEVDLRAVPRGLKPSSAKLSALSILDQMAGSDGRVGAVAWTDRCIEPGSISKAENEKGRRDVFNRAKREMLAAKLITSGRNDAGEWVARPNFQAVAGPIGIPSF